jgi:hypothetical protein
MIAEMLPLLPLLWLAQSAHPGSPSACPPAANLRFEAQLVGRTEALSGQGAYLETQGQRLFVTALELWTRAPAISGNSPTSTLASLALIDWSQQVRSVSLHCDSEPIALGGPARGGLDEWWSDLLLLEVPEGAKTPTALTLSPALPETGASLWWCPLASPANTTPTPIPVRVVEQLQESGVPAVELVCHLQGPQVPPPGAALLDRDGRLVALVSSSEAVPTGRMLRAQCLAPALALPPAAPGQRLVARVGPGLFDRLSSNGERLIFGASVLGGMRALEADSGSIDQALGAWSEYRLVSFSPDGLFLVGLHPVRGVEWCDAASLEPLLRFADLPSSPESLEFSPAGERLFCADLGPGGVLELDLTTSSVRRVSARGADLLAVGPAGRWLALGERWTAAAPGLSALRLLRRSGKDDPNAFEEQPIDVPGPILALAAAPERDLCAYAQGSSVRVIDVTTAAEVWSADLAPLLPTALCFSATGQGLWVGTGREVSAEDGLRYADGCALLLLETASGRVLARSGALGAPAITLTREPSSRGASPDSSVELEVSDGILALDGTGAVYRCWPPKASPPKRAEPK